MRKKLTKRARTWYLNNTGIGELGADVQIECTKPLGVAIPMFSFEICRFLAALYS